MLPFVIRANLIFPLLLLLLLLASSVPVLTSASANNNFSSKVRVRVRSSASNSNPLYKKEERIINGETAQEDRYPYSITLQNGWGHFCGGSLIGNDVILTAAHCTVGSKFSVRIGSNHVDKGVLISTKRTVRHPNYNANTNEFDIAIVFLKNSITSLSLNIPLVRVNNNSSYPMAGSSVVAMGWGGTASGGDESSFPDDLQEVDLEVISYDNCDNFKIGRDSYEGLIYDSMLCTYTEGKDACQGDSGGPLIVLGNAPEEDIQVGISSWGIQCAALPGVFSRISEAYSWTVDTVCNEDSGSNDPPPSLCGGGGADAGVIAPSSSLSAEPTLEPALEPTSEPTLEPTLKPTTLAPTFSPIERPTDSPSVSREPSSQPSGEPSMEPSLEPSNQPSLRASSQPSLSSRPSGRPSQQPTHNPSILPSQIPTIIISEYPSTEPYLTSSSIPSYSSPTVTASPTTMLSSLTISASPNVKLEYDKTVPGDSLLSSGDSKETTTDNSSSTIGCSFAIGTLLLCCVTSAWMGLLI